MTNRKDDWNVHWDALSDAALVNPAQNYRFHLIQEELSLFKNLSEKLVVIDLGCGSGDLIHQLSEKFGEYELIGIEPSASGSRISKLKNSKTEIIQSDITKDALSDVALSRADVVICTEVLEHLDNPIELMSALSSKIGVGTKILLTVPGGPRSKFDIYIGHRRHFSKRRLLGLLVENGFTNVEVSRAGFPGHNIYKSLTILMGNKLISSSHDFQKTARFTLASDVFYWLMVRSFKNSIFGWQLIAVSEKGIE
jgi:SAM-dependent methyltransferase